MSGRWGKTEEHPAGTEWGYLYGGAILREVRFDVDRYIYYYIKD
jgi:hypothetical protein